MTKMRVLSSCFFIREAITVPSAFSEKESLDYAQIELQAQTRVVTLLKATMLTSERKVTVADMSSTLRYDATMGKGEMAIR